MAFAFDPRAPSEAEFRRIAKDQADAAIKTIDADEKPDETVHSLRQRCKKLRGLLQLIRPRFKQWRQENDTVRDLASALSATRDSTVLADTLAGLLGDEVSHSPVMTALRKHIEAEGAKSDYAATMAQCRVGMEQLRTRAEGWKLKGDGFEVLCEGFQGTYERMGKGMRTARRGPTDENFHAWRKQAKYHLYQLSLLRRCAPDVITAPLEVAKNLGDILGKHHDLAVLTEVLHTKRFQRIAKVAAVLDAAEKKQQAQEAEAFGLGGQLTAEQPKAIARRFSAYWENSIEDA